MAELPPRLHLAQLEPARWRQIQALLDEVLDRPDEDRGECLDRACAGDVELRMQVETLIAADTEAADFLSVPASRFAAPLEPPFVWGRLRAVEAIGSGNFGTVYRAQDATLGMDVALKIWHAPAGSRDEELERRIWEARRLARVRHPNILLVHGVDEHDGRFGLWTELVEGATLEQHLARAGPMSADEAVAIGRCVCGALATLHAAGLVHRDVKTTNVMRDHAGRVVLVDFGTVRELKSSGVIAADEPAMGTPATMAPEQLRGGDTGPAADVYGVGVLLYRLVSFHYPIEAETLLDLQMRHARGDRVPLIARCPDLPNAFVEVVEHALAADPAQRYSSVGALDAALRELAAAMPGSGVPVPADVEAATPARMLPRSLTRFIGRTGALERSTAALRASRLLTLTGPAGSGKTRLGLELAEREAPRFASGAWFVDLAVVRPGDSIVETMSTALGLHAAKEGDALERLETRLSPMHALLLLDNCEHVRDELADPLSRLLQTCPRLTVLATSRVPLGISAETVHQVPPLELPEPDADSAAIKDAESVRLFVERASYAQFGFALDPVAHEVAEICRRLEGIPLAIELAASNVRRHTPRELLQRLDDRLRVLSLAARAMPGRHRTLEAAIQWSFDLLGAEDRALLPMLGVFEGGWTAEAAGAVCLPGIDDFEVLQRLGGLVEASLVLVEPNSRGGTRYRLLEAVRAFALERQAIPDIREALQRRHVGYFRDMAAAMEPLFWGPRQSESLARLDEDHPNLLAGIRAAATLPGMLEHALVLAGSMYRYWFSRGLVRTGRSLLEELLARPEAATASAAGLRARFAAGGLAIFDGDVDHARARFEQGLEQVLPEGELRAARWRVGLSSVAQRAGDFAEARSQLERALAVYRESGDRSSQIVVLHNLAEVALCEGRFDTGFQLQLETLERARDAGNALYEAQACIFLGAVAARQGRAAESLSYLRLAREGVGRVRAKILGIELIEAACELALTDGDAARAASWLAVTDSEREVSGLARSPSAKLGRSGMQKRIDEQQGAGRLEPGTWVATGDRRADPSTRRRWTMWGLGFSEGRSLSAWRH